MPKVGKLLAGTLAAIGVPTLAAVQWRSVVAGRPLLALGLTLVWECFVGLFALILVIANRPVTRRLEQFGDAMDQALGRRFSRYTRQQRRHVLSALQFIDAKGLATAGHSIPELDEVFIDVGLTPSAPHLVTSGLLVESPTGPFRRHSIHDLIRQVKPAVLAVIGAPGSGKTTLLRHVARSIAKSPRKSRRNVAVLLTLRDCDKYISTDRQITLPELMRKTTPALSVSEPSGWWETCLARGRCVVLLDGLDEVATETSRRVVADWIERQIAAYVDNDYIITSRPHGYQTAIIGRAQVVQVMPFTGEQIRRFLHGWYRASERTATGRGDKDKDIRNVDGRARTAANDLLDRLAGNPGLYDLAINPLLLTMIANVHRYRGALPGSRPDLYSEVCQVVLWRRQEAKG